MRWQSTTLRVAGLVFLLQALAAVGLMSVMAAVLQAEIKSAAQTRGEMLRNEVLTVSAKGGRSALIDVARLRSQAAIVPDTVHLLVDAAGTKLGGNLAHWPPDVRLDGRYSDITLYRVGVLKPEAMWVRATRLPGGDRLLTGGIVEGERRVTRALEAAGALGLALAVAFAAIAAWLTARTITARLYRTVETLDAVRGGDLARRVPEDVSQDAFAALSASINATLERVDALVGELKIATDGLAHDLKSPLSRLRSSLERAAIVVREPEAQDAIDRAMDESQRLLTIVETALRISRAEAGVGRDAFVVADLARELHDLAEIYGPVAEENGRVVRVESAGEVRLPVQRELLAQAIGNLIDNAIAYGAGAITLSLQVRPVEIVVSVADRGIGIPVELHAQALKRFGRLDEARQHSGAGLGLALARAVAHLHGGTLQLDDNRPGLVVSLVLPRLPETDGSSRRR